MSLYANAVVMLVATIAGFFILAKLMQALRARRLGLPWRGPVSAGVPAARLRVEQSCMIDGKRRLVLVRCDELRVLLMTGGPADLVVSALPAGVAAGEVA